LENADFYVKKCLLQVVTLKFYQVKKMEEKKEIRLTQTVQSAG